MSSLRSYLDLMQYRIVALLALSAVAGFAIAYSGGAMVFQNLALVVLAIIASGSGAELLNKVLEIDIDRKMERTRNRASVRGRISKTHGLAYGIILSIIGIALGYAINTITAAMVFLGIFFYIVVYTMWLKRRSRFSIVIGGLAGSFCVWAGATAASGTVAVPGFVLGLLVLLWIPGHIWSFAIKYKEDYIKAGVPMLTAVESKKTGTRVIALFNILMAAFSVYLVLFLGAYYAAIIVVPLIIALYLSFKTMINSKSAWVLFKFSSVYLTLAFIGVIVASAV